MLVKNILSIAAAALVGLGIGRAWDTLSTELSRVAVPSITLPRSTILDQLLVLLKLPSTHLVIFAVMVLLINLLVVWVNPRPEVYKKLVAVNIAAVTWGILSVALVWG